VDRSWRKLNEARQRSEIQRMSVDLARQRVDSTTMLIDAGRAEMRDLLDAQASLVHARNAHLQTLVDYRMSTLEMWRDMGVLAFRDGQFTEEIEDAGTQKQP
jgi:outer membrane protein TolC